MNLVIISLKMVYSFNPFMSLNICVNFRDLNCQHICWDNRLLQIIKQCAKNNMSVYYANNALHSETPINTFNNIQKYCILWILLYHHNISHCLIYSRWNSDTITLIIDNLCGFCWLESIYIINLNSDYGKSLMT